MLIVVVQSNFLMRYLLEANTWKDQLVRHRNYFFSHQEITGATVYPGYAGAAKAVLETRYHF
jgi:PII-like signaling protein